MQTTTPIRFNECYPAEIVSWINDFPPPDDCTPHQLGILRLIDSAEGITQGGMVLRHLDTIGSREEAAAAIASFKSLLELAHCPPRKARKRANL